MHQHRPVWAASFFVLAFLVATLVRSEHGQCAETIRVAVVQSQESRGPNDSLKKIQAAVSEALSSAGVETVPAGRMPKEVASCRGADCAEIAGASTDATHAFVVRAQYADEAFNMVIEVWSTRSKALVASEARDCAICDLKDFERAAHALTMALVPRIPQPSLTETETKPIDPPVAAKTHDDGKTAMTIGRWVGLGIGIALIGVGAYYLSKDGDPSCRAGETAPCDRIHDTKVGALTLMGTGALIGTAAIIVPMLWESDKQTLMAGVRLMGTF